ncbi:unnamed protein product [Closterium sp. NIES-54]
MVINYVWRGQLPGRVSSSFDITRFGNQTSRKNASSQLFCQIPSGNASIRSSSHSRLSHRSVSHRELSHILSHRGSSHGNPSPGGFYDQALRSVLARSQSGTGTAATSAPLPAEAEPPPERALDRAPVYLKDMSFQQLEDWVAAECGEEHRRRAKVLWKWLYRDAHWAESTDDMAGVSRSFLSLLASSGARFSSLRLHSVRTAADGTKKVLFELSRDADLPPSDRPRRLGVVETVLIPHRPGRGGGEGGVEEEEEEGSGSEEEAEGGGMSRTDGTEASGSSRGSRSSRSSSSSRRRIKGGRNTVCVSTQLGCAMGCQFCFTAKMGLQRNLTAGEIVDQVVQIRRLFTEEVGPVTNLVFMGMGEPLHNLPAVLTACNTLLDPLGAHCSPARTTVSTCGLVPEMHEFCSHSDASLALSLHATTDEVRSSIMPINKKHNLSSLFACLSELFPSPAGQTAGRAEGGGDMRDGCNGEEGMRLPQQSSKRHVFIEYLMLDGVNDSLEDARRLVTLTAGIACKINLIVFNPHPGTALQPSPLPRVLAFQHELVQGGRKAYLRHSRGDDEMAACGQLGQVPRLTEDRAAAVA